MTTPRPSHRSRRRTVAVALVALGLAAGPLAACGDECGIRRILQRRACEVTQASGPCAEQGLALELADVAAQLPFPERQGAVEPGRSGQDAACQQLSHLPPAESLARFERQGRAAARMFDERELRMQVRNVAEQQ